MSGAILAPLLQRSRRAVLLPVLVVLAAGWAPGRDPARPASTAPPIVLGSKNFVRDGIGWGTAHPRRIFNGGDPSGLATGLRWSGWGGRAALARGLTSIFRPHGGYYAKPGAVELRAYGIGRCSPTGPRAYLHLQAREAARPGGPLGKWFLWGGQHNLCHWA